MLFWSVNLKHLSAYLNVCATTTKHYISKMLINTYLCFGSTGSSSFTVIFHATFLNRITNTCEPFHMHFKIRMLALHVLNITAATAIAPPSCYSAPMPFEIDCFNVNAECFERSLCNGIICIWLLFVCSQLGACLSLSLADFNSWRFGNNF